MRRYSMILVVLWAILSIGCGPAVPQETTEVSRGEGPARIATDPDDAVVKTSVLYEGPPHVFSPRFHQPIRRQGASPAPDFRSFPRLKMRFGKCFGERKERSRPAQIAKGSAMRGASRGGGTGTGYGRGSGGGGAKGGFAVKKKDKGRTKTPKRASGKQRPPSMDGAASMPPPTPSAQPNQPTTPAKPAGESAGAAVSRSAPASTPDFAADSAMAMSEEAEAPAEYYKGEAGEDNNLRIAEGGDSDDLLIADEKVPLDEYEDWGAAIYLSNDDTMSLSSAQRVIYAIDNFLPLPSEHIRPHELLNYFSFNTSVVAEGADFSVLGDIQPDTRETGIYSLGLAVRGRAVDKTSRRNTVLTMVIDRSGSMRDEGRMDYLKRGLFRMLDELKDGDMVHLILFDHEVCVPTENFVVGRDSRNKIEKVIKALKPRGATDLHRGLTSGYGIADRTYRDDSSNRVVMITDALTNTGVTNEQMISMISKFYDTRRIRLSGVGVGRDFNDGLLDRLTERGKGAYVFLGSETEVDAVFGNRFVSLIETTALDTHFRLHLPPSLRMNVFYGEESSVLKSDVQEIHYFANTSQLFLSDLMARGGTLRIQDQVMLSIEYKDPETNKELVEEYAFNLGDIRGTTKNVEKARLIMAWVDMLAQMAARPIPSGYGRSHGGWLDADGWQRCDDGRVELEKLAEPVSDDAEVHRVLELWGKYCARYERPRNPVKRQVVAPNDAWPGASSGNRR
jgi:von Willebrand factor type A domain